MPLVSALIPFPSETANIDANRFFSFGSGRWVHHHEGAKSRRRPQVDAARRSYRLGYSSFWTTEREGYERYLKSDDTAPEDKNKALRAGCS